MIWAIRNGWATDDLTWYIRNFKMIYHLKCMFMDGAE